MDTKFKRLINKYGILLLISFLVASFPISPLLDNYINGLDIHDKGLIWFLGILIPMMVNLIITILIFFDLRKNQIKSIWVIISTLIYPILGVVMFLLLVLKKKENIKASS